MSFTVEDLRAAKRMLEEATKLYEREFAEQDPFVVCGRSYYAQVTGQELVCTQCGVKPAAYVGRVSQMTDPFVCDPCTLGMKEN